MFNECSEYMKIKHMFFGCFLKKTKKQNHYFHSFSIYGFECDYLLISQPATLNTFYVSSVCTLVVWTTCPPDCKGCMFCIFPEGEGEFLWKCALIMSGALGKLCKVFPGTYCQPLKGPHPLPTHMHKGFVFYNYSRLICLQMYMLLSPIFATLCFHLTPQTPPCSISWELSCRSREMFGNSFRGGVTNANILILIWWKKWYNLQV